MVKIISSSLILFFIFSQTSQAAIEPPSYQVNMRVGLKGQSPIAIHTVAKSGKKSFVSEISDDGQSETLVEVYAKKTQLNNQSGIYMDVVVTKRVHGVKRASERTQLFAPENQELEVGMGNRGRMAGNLALAVMAHQL
ncbi:MAG TPA: hypothetical protein VN132_10105 [Bdellovibrio sp.]|nr:hypothetical protein [Bdellovibrio sp.]